MNIRDLIRDHGLDARDFDEGHYWATCPVCFTAGHLDLDVRQNTFKCHRCGLKGTADELDARIRRVRGDGRLR